jgi:hypothetical protein
MKFNRYATIDDVALYLGRGCSIHPLLYDYFHDELDHLARTGKISLTPSTIFEKFHRKISKVA